MASQITNVSIVCSIVCSGTGQRKHQSSASLAIVGGIHRSPADFPQKGPVTRKMFPFDNVIMIQGYWRGAHLWWLWTIFLNFCPDQDSFEATVLKSWSGLWYENLWNGTMFYCTYACETILSCLILPYLILYSLSYIPWTQWGRQNKLPPFCRWHLQWIFLYENCIVFIQVSLKFVPKVPNNDMLILVQIMA